MNEYINRFVTDKVLCGLNIRKPIALIGFYWFSCMIDSMKEIEKL